MTQDTSNPSRKDLLEVPRRQPTDRMFTIVHPHTDLKPSGPSVPGVAIPAYGVIA